MSTLFIFVAVVLAGLANSAPNSHGPQVKGRGKELQKLYHLIESQTEQIQQLTEQLSEVTHRTDSLIEKRDSGPNTVAFTVTIKSGSPLINIPHGSPVVFNHVNYNAGGGYDNTTGVFTAPTAGIYLFTYFITPYLGSHVNILFKINGGTFTQAAAEPVTDTHEVTGGNGVVLPMVVGDQVWLTPYEDNVSLFGSFTSLTGVLVQRL